MVFTCATRIFDAATIFMALVIFAMFCTERIRCFTASQRRGVLGLPSRLKHSILCQATSSTIRCWKVKALT